MKTKKIYLVRHGQTDFNKKGIVQGSGIDAPLNEKGRQQAASFYDAYQHLEFQKVYTSSLIRTHQSVEGFINKGLEHIQLPGLNEINWGHKEGQIIDFGNDEYFNKMVKEWRAGNTGLKIAGGESPQDVADRQKPALQEIIHGDEELALVCMHGRAIRIILCLMLDHPLNRMDEFPHSNLGLYTLTYQNETFSIDETNNVDHLSHLELK